VNQVALYIFQNLKNELIMKNMNTNKQEKALSLGVPIITEEDYLKLI